MTEKLYDRDSHIFEFNATVVSCEKCKDCFAVILDKTAFFPEGGGQPSDVGKLGEARVFDVQIENDIIHYADRPVPVGSRVVGKLDSKRRLDFMCQHSAEHIVSGIVHEKYGYENVGFHLSEETVTLDFDGIITAEQLSEIELEVNARVRENVKFRAFYPSSEELELLNYRSKKEIDGAVRIVEIENTDCCACCAPHVYESSEIGCVYLENLGKMRGGTRLSLKAGERAVTAHRQTADELHRISALLAAKQGEEGKAVEALLNSSELRQRQFADMERQLLRALTDAAKQDETAVFANVSGESVFRLADSLYERFGVLRAVFSPSDDGFNFAVRGNEEELSEAFESFKNSFTVRGGGRNGMRRGYVCAKECELKKFFQL